MIIIKNLSKWIRLSNVAGAICITLIILDLTLGNHFKSPLFFLLWYIISAVSLLLFLFAEVMKFIVKRALKKELGK